MLLAAWMLGFSGFVNQPPAAPMITEPLTDGTVVNPADLHMETGPFADPDARDGHLCTDWEIWTVAPLERVWVRACAMGIERLHTHLGDGVFENSHAGRGDLAADEEFLLRVRHGDDSGDAATQWSAVSERAFRTGSAMQVFPLELEDLSPLPAPRWVVSTTGEDVILPAQSILPKVWVESVAGDLLLSIEARDGASHTITNPPALSQHVPVRVRIAGGSQTYSLPASDLLFVDEQCGTHRLLLPAATIVPGAMHVYWVSDAGAIYLATSAETDPVFTTLARGLEPPWSPQREGFRVEVFASGLQLPVNIAFVPHPGPDPDSPFLYVTEFYGAIRVVTRDRTVSTYAGGLLDFDPTGVFPGSGVQGLAGLAVDPATGDVYASMLYAPASDPDLRFPKVVRFTSQDGGRTAASQTTVLDMVNEVQGQSHQISNLTIAPDGKLLCHMGDGFIPETALDLDSFRGKILRLNLDGSAVPDNPFYDAGNGITARDYVFAYGLRNPFGGDWRFADGSHYEVENGPGVDRFAKVVAGRNFGWDGTNASMTSFALWNWSPACAPVSLAFVQPETFGGSGFPQPLMGHAFVTESGPTYAAGPQVLGKRISEWILDASGQLVAGPIPFLEYAGDGRATACGLEAGPDGLYMTELFSDLGAVPTEAGARILRIYFDPGGDCNASGTEDLCDIAEGTSADSNANWVPDECESSATPVCFGDGTGIPCPCDNTGLPGRGCDNSMPGMGGARLSGFGGALLSADTLLLISSGERPTALSVFWQSDVEVAPRPFGDGLGCLGGHLERLYVHTALGGTVRSPQGSDLPVSARSAALGDPIAPGATRLYHVFYRDGDPGFCPAPAGSTINTTNGLRVLWGP
ncbi:MAG: PQQ-dependent sugar dehydrogenase [Planctomycetota bacterium]